MYVDVAELSREWWELIEKIGEGDGELTPEQNERLKELGEGVDNIMEKFAGIIKYYRKQSSACKEEAEEMVRKAEVHENKAKNTEKFLHEFLKRVCTDKTKGGNLQYKTAKLSITENTSKSLSVFNPYALPGKFRRYSVLVDNIATETQAIALQQTCTGLPGATTKLEEVILKKEIIAALKNKEVVAGVGFVTKTGIIIK